MISAKYKIIKPFSTNTNSLLIEDDEVYVERKTMAKLYNLWDAVSGDKAFLGGIDDSTFERCIEVIVIEE